MGSASHPTACSAKPATGINATHRHLHVATPDMQSKPPSTTTAAITGSASIAALLVVSAHPSSGQITVGAGFTVDDTTFNWDVDGNAVIDLNIGDAAGSMSLFAPGTAAGGSWMASAGGKLAAMATTANVSVGANFRNGAYLTVAGDLGSQAAGFTSVGASYVGFRFKISGNTHYGWAQITPTFGTGSSIQVNQWAYNSLADSAIQIGQTSAVPEPAAAATGLGLLALGAAGLRRQRWLKREAA